MTRDPGPIDAGAAAALGCTELLEPQDVEARPSEREPIKVVLTVREEDNPALRARLGRALARLLWPERRAPRGAL